MECAKAPDAFCNDTSAPLSNSTPEVVEQKVEKIVHVPRIELQVEEVVRYVPQIQEKIVEPQVCGARSNGWTPFCRWI